MYMRTRHDYDDDLLDLLSLLVGCLACKFHLAQLGLSLRGLLGLAGSLAGRLSILNKKRIKFIKKGTYLSRK